MGCRGWERGDGVSREMGGGVGREGGDWGGEARVSRISEKEARIEGV